jgi:hypothetical protein
MNLMDKMVNPRGAAAKKWLSELLKDRYPNHDQIVERISNVIVTDQDMQNFGKLAVDLYEVGYIKCMNDYKRKLDELGIKVSIVPEKK